MMIDGSGAHLTRIDGSTEAVLDIGLHAHADTAFTNQPGTRASTGAYIVTTAAFPLI